MRKFPPSVKSCPCMPNSCVGKGHIELLQLLKDLTVLLSAFQYILNWATKANGKWKWSHFLGQLLAIRRGGDKDVHQDLCQLCFFTACILSCRLKPSKVYFVNLLMDGNLGDPLRHRVPISRNYARFETLSVAEAIICLGSKSTVKITGPENFCLREQRQTSKWSEKNWR